jgi:hypothetical protein
LLPDDQGTNAIHAWCQWFYRFTGWGQGTDLLPFGVGHMIESIPAGIDTTIRLGDFVGAWRDDEPLTDSKTAIDDRYTGMQTRDGTRVHLRDLHRNRMYMRIEGAHTRLQREAEKHFGRQLTEAEQISLADQLIKIEAELEAQAVETPDTSSAEDSHIWWTFRRLAPVCNGHPCPVREIGTDASSVTENQVRNATDQIRRLLGISAFPKTPRKKESSPRSRRSI